MSKKIIIISGGEIEDEHALSVLNEDDAYYVIGVDRGVEFLYRHNIMPNYIVGDFDSLNPEIAD